MTEPTNTSSDLDEAGRSGTSVTNPDRACVHPNFEGTVTVGRLYEGDEVGAPDAYMAEIRVSCSACGEPFRWSGVQAGLSQRRPMCSVDEVELRAPLRPASADPDFGMGIPGFAVTWKDNR